MTFFVAICDDEKRICSNLENSLKEIFNKLNVRYEIDVYFTGEGLCNKIKSGTQYDLIFLDIELGENCVNGIEVGKKIRDIDNCDKASIVYISQETKYSMQLFDIRPLNFLIKPIKFDKIEQVVNTYLKLTGSRTKDFIYRVRHDTFKVKVKDIVYLESIRRKLTLHLADGSKEMFYGTLKQVYYEQLYKFDFLFIHASFAVNYDYISELSKDKVALSCGAISLPISQQRKKEVKESYFSIAERRWGT